MYFILMSWKEICPSPVVIAFATASFAANIPAALS